MIRFQRKKKPGSILNITPLIDVIFLLLLFFMLTSTFISKPGIEVSLPEALTAEPEQEQEITIYISKESEFHLDDEPVQPDDLKTKLEQKMSETAGKKIIVIKSDKDAKVGATVHVIDTARKLKAEGVVISTDPAGRPR